MPRLPRPAIPLEVKARVLLRQLGELWPDDCVRGAKEARSLGYFVNGLLGSLAELLECEAKDLRLDHDPALENRLKELRLPNGRKSKGVFVPEGAKVTRYYPDANDPEHLIYREKHAHHIKTNVRGDGAQYADNVLAKRERKRQKKAERPRPTRLKGKRPWPRGRKIPSRPFSKKNPGK